MKGKNFIIIPGINMIVSMRGIRKLTSVFLKFDFFKKIYNSKTIENNYPNKKI